MPTASPKGGKTFDEDISALHDEIRLAVKWGRPSILLAVHKSKPSQERAEAELEKRLLQDGCSVAQLVVTPEQADVPHLIVAGPRSDLTVFFISNIDWGGGQDGKDAYRALNLYRELFVDNHIKAVFSLTANEAANLARHAPDFWAFRHRVIEFPSVRAAHMAGLPAGLLLWDIPETVDPFDSLGEKIRAREDIMSKLPSNSEALSTKVDLWYALANLYWLQDDAARAAAALKSGLALALGHKLPELAWHLLNGTGIMQHEAGLYHSAIETYQRALEAAPESSALLINLSAATCMLGRNTDAITHAKRAVRVDPSDGRTWHALGHIYAAMGKMDDARTCLIEAVTLAPRSARYHESLAAIYSLIERGDEAMRHLEAAKQLEPRSGGRLLEAYTAAARGDTSGAETVLRQGLAAGVLNKAEIRRDPILALLLATSLIKEISGV